MGNTSLEMAAALHEMARDMDYYDYEGTAKTEIECLKRAIDFLKASQNKNGDVAVLLYTLEMIAM